MISQIKTAVKDTLLQILINVENSKEKSLEYDLDCIMYTLTEF